MSRGKKERKKGKKLKPYPNGNVLVTQGNKVETMVEKNFKTRFGFEYKSRPLENIEPDLTSDQPLFVVKSGINGGDSVKIIPIRFFNSKGNKQLFIEGYLERGTIRINDRLKLIDEGNYHSFRFIFIESIKVNNLFLDCVIFNPKNTRDGNIIEISILNDKQEVFDYAELIRFNNRMTRPL